jgi:hypothetical protein
MRASFLAFGSTAVKCRVQSSMGLISNEVMQILMAYNQDGLQPRNCCGGYLGACTSSRVRALPQSCRFNMI